MSRETVVFVPGLACTRDLFEQQMGVLAASRNIEVADHTRDESMEAIARRLLAAVAAPRFALVGLSMGGYVALETLRLAPDRVTRIALLNTSARADAPEALEQRMRLVELAQAGRLADIVETLWPRLVHPDRAGDTALREVVDRMMRETGGEAFARQQRAIIGRHDSRRLLPAMRIPALVLTGEQDALISPDLSREMAQLIGTASLVRIPDCGHLSTLEKPAEVTAALEAWLARDGA